MAIRLKIPALPSADDNVLRLFPDNPDEDRRVFETWWYQYWDNLSRYIKANSNGSLTVPFVTPEQFGAIGDGIVDDTSAVQEAIDDGRAVMMHSEAVYSVSNLTLRSNLTIFGLPGATLQQRSATAVSGTPFIVGDSISDLSITGVIFDGNKGAQGGATNVTGLSLQDVDRVSLQECGVRNTSGIGVGGWIWKNVDIGHLTAFNWGIGNDFSAIYKQDGTISPSPPHGDSYKINIHDCDLDGSGCGSVIKIMGKQDNPEYDISVTGNIVTVGFPPTGDPGALGIEIWNGTGSSTSYVSRFVVADNIVTGEVGVDIAAMFGISISIGQDGSITGNMVRNCGAWSIEIIGSNISCIGNACINVGRMSLTLSHVCLENFENIIVQGNIIETTAAPFAGFPMAGIHVYSEGDFAWSHIIINGNRITLNNIDQFGIWLQNNSNFVLPTDTLWEYVQVNNNIINGSGYAGTTGIACFADRGRKGFVSGNQLIGLEIGINISTLTESRVLWNMFDSSVINNYGGSPDASSMIVDVDNTEGTNFAPLGVQLRARPYASIDKDGSFWLGAETTYAGMFPPGTVSSPNNVYLNAVNFSTELQGGVLSVNSKWDGNPNWTKTTTSTYDGAMFLILGAGAFSVQFGLATNAGSAAPGTTAFSVVSKDNVQGELPRVYTGVDYPLYIQNLAPIFSGSANPEGNIVASPGSFYLRYPGVPYYKATGSGDTGWIALAASGSGVTSLNALTGALSIIAGSGVSVTPAGSNITIAATGGGAPSTATYITQTPDAGLSAEQALSLLATGILKSTTATGIISIATAADLPVTGAPASFSPSMACTSGTVTIISSDCSYQADIVNPKLVFIKYILSFSVSVSSAAVFLSMPVTPKSTAATYSQPFAMGYQDGSDVPKTSWNAVEAAFSRVDMFLFSGSFVSGTTHHVELNGYIETA